MEMKTVRAMPDGFEIEFTLPVDKASAENLASYGGKNFIYKYHPVYGSPPINDAALNIKGVKVSDDGMKVRLLIDNIKQAYLHEIKVEGIRSREGNLPVLHPTAYYTLNNIPDGAKLSMAEVSTKRMEVAPAKTTEELKVKVPKAKKGKETAEAKAPSYDKVQPLLAKWTCLGCHNTNTRQVGPSFTDIAKRKYSNERIVELIYKPEPKNWPEYATEMAPMPQIPKADALKMAAWINSLRQETP
jgi:cytochrome c551/c552